MKSTIRAACQTSTTNHASTASELNAYTPPTKARIKLPLRERTSTRFTMNILLLETRSGSLLLKQTIGAGKMAIGPVPDVSYNNGMHLRLAVIATLVFAISAQAGITFDPPAPATHHFVKLVIDEDFWPGACV